MKPSNGRVVHLHYDGLRPEHARLCNGGKCVTAIVVGVDPETKRATLDVRWPTDGPRPLNIWHNIAEGTEPGTWHWPERVE